MKIRLLSFGLALTAICACSIVDNYDEALMADVLSSSSNEDAEISSSSIKINSSSSKENVRSSSSEELSSSSLEISSSSEERSSSSLEISSSSEEQSSSSLGISSSSEAPSSSSREISSSSVEQSSSSLGISSSSEAPSSSSREISSSSVESFVCGESMVKRGEDSYKTVSIKNLCFTAENMKYAPSVGNSMCYDGNESRCDVYGRLYDYEAASVACPSGWRLPTSQELIELQEFTGDDVLDAGAHFKASFGWNSESGDDLLEFSGLPGGMCDSDGDCSNVGSRGYWWTSTESIKNQSHFTLFLNDDGDSFSAETKMMNGNFVSVRCVKK